MPWTTDEKSRDEILGILSSWLGDMNKQMKESFSQRFDEAIEWVKEELIDYVESTEAVSTLENHSKESTRC